MSGIWGELAYGLAYWLFESGLAALANHLWQSTLFAVAIGALVFMLRGHSARLRHALWTVASLKFLVPFALFAALGTQISWKPELGEASAQLPRVLAVAGELAAPVQRSDVFPTTSSTVGSPEWTGIAWLVLLAIWLPGMLFVAGRWWLRWRALRRLLRAAIPTAGIEFPAPVRITAEPMEPGIVGIFRPVLLLPAGMAERLSPAQMRAVLAHEACHLRRRDNLMAALHMLVEMLFWYHPLVWWIGRRLIDERERACDEQVLREGHAPQHYGEAILAVCEHYVAARLPCVAGVSGSDLRRRIELIARNPVIAALGRSRRLVLGALALLGVALPIAAGVVGWRSSQVRALNRDAMEQYFTVLNATGSVPCTAPDAALVARQRELAATVAGLEAGDTRRALIYAVLANSEADVRRLLAAGAPQDADGFILGSSLMHVAARAADPPVLQALVEAGLSLEGFEGFLGSGPNLQLGQTPLMVAISAGRMQNVEWLIAHGADVNATNGSGNSALTSALAACADQALVTQLINAGAVPNDKARRIARNLQIDLGAAAPDVEVAPVQPLPTPARQSREPASSPATPDAAERMQQDWRRPTREELDAEAMRSSSPARYAEAEADFDGDGVNDLAALFVSINGLSEGLFVRLSSRGADGWQQAAGVVRIVQAAGPVMGISVAKPGKYATACGKGYWTCGEGEPAEVQLEQPGIEFFRFESASSLVYWDKSGASFKRIWTSD